ncbi:hypothetical protein ACLB6G_20595 [Zhengella sp. ZM62]|uniref:hypothetical protein n=1 Tax=Zhengella sedimenti TaxID=3390035 RepID=UPI003974CEAE
MNLDYRGSQELRLARILETAECCEMSCLRKERELMNVKWFEYRFMSPAKATSLFAQEYREAFRRSFAANIDFRQAENVSGINSRTMFENRRVRTQVWRARQRADETGMPYNHYLSAAFKFAERRQRKWLPQPSQLHFPDSAHEAWTEFRDRYWEECLRDLSPDVANDPAFLIENYCGLPAQDAYRMFIVGEGRRHHRNVGGLLQTYTFQKRQVPAEMFRELVPEDIYQSAVEDTEASWEKWSELCEPTQELECRKHDLWPSCLGLPNVQDLSVAPCISCPLADLCSRVAAGISLKLVERHGSDDPAADRKRVQARLRKQRQRERAKAAMSATPPAPERVTHLVVTPA